MNTSTKRQSKAAIELAEARALIAQLQANGATVPAPVALTPEQAALQSGANGFFVVTIGGHEAAFRKDILRYMRNWSLLNLIEDLEQAVRDGKSVDFGEQTCSFRFAVGNEKVTEAPINLCGVEVSASRKQAPTAETGARFTRTTPRRAL